MKKSLKISFFSPPMTSSNVNQVMNCVNILTPFSECIYVFLLYKDLISLDTSKYTEVINIIHKSKSTPIERIFGYISTQIKIVIHLLRISNKINTCFFFMGDGLILPIIISKLLNKKVILLLGGSYEDVIKYNKSILYEIIMFFRIFNLMCSDRIIVYSPILIDKWNLKNYRHKIFFAHEHYINFQDFHLITDYAQRDLLIGYIGYLDELKGVCNFVKTFPQVSKINSSVRFFIGGTGPLYEKIRRYCLLNELIEHFSIMGWIPHDKLKYELNKLKLLVLPSNSEGLPNIVLEAMACGTPVLATSVGAIPDIIKDGENGFIMNSNSVECIQENIMRALNYKNINDVSKNAIKYIEDTFNYNETVLTMEHSLNSFS